MFLKHFSFYELGRKLTLSTLNELNDALAIRKQRPLGKAERVCDGFLQPFPKLHPGAYMAYIGVNDYDWHREFQFGDELGHFGQEDLPAFQDKPFPLKDFSPRGTDALMLLFYREEKVVISSFVKRRVQERVDEIESNEARKVYTKERHQIRDDIVSKLLPAAQTRMWQAPVIFFSSGFVAIGAVGRNADIVAAEIRDILGTFPIQRLRTKHSSASVLTAIAKAQAEDDFDRFQITSDFQFQATTERPSVARCKNTDITDDNVQGLLTDKVVSHAAMRWADKVSFKIDPKMDIRSLRVDDAVFEGREDEEEELDYDHARIASMIIEYTLVNQMLHELVELHGGPERRDGEEEAMNEEVSVSPERRQAAREEEDEDED